jgi:hypothetical protein
MQKGKHMDHDQRTKAAKSQDPEWAARLVRNIAQVEADFFHAAGAISERMMSEAVQSMHKANAAPWQVVETGLSALIVCPDWKMVRGNGTGDMWLELSEIGADEQDDEHCWLAAAVKAGPTQLGIEVKFRPGLQDHADAVIRDDKVIAALLKLGFAREETDLVLFVPVQIAAEKLAQGFEQNDLGAALAPVGASVAKAIAAKAELDKVLLQVREAAKRK